MDIIGRVIARLQQLTDRKRIKTIKRKQFNLTMAEDIVFGVKFIAVIMQVPMYVVCEHILQVGSYHLLEAMDDQESRKRLKDHLVQVHLLGDELKEDDILSISRKNLQMDKV